MKTILINVAEGGALAVSDTVLGRSGEHANTTLQIVLGDTTLAACASFRLWLGNRYTPRLFATNGQLTYVVPEDALIPPSVRLQVCGYQTANGVVTLVARSQTAVLTVESSAYGTILCPDAIEPFENLSAECANAANAALLAKESAINAGAIATRRAGECADSEATVIAKAAEATSSAEAASDSAAAAQESAAACAADAAEVSAKASEAARFAAVAEQAAEDATASVAAAQQAVDQAAAAVAAAIENNGEPTASALDLAGTYPDMTVGTAKHFNTYETDLVSSRMHRAHNGKWFGSGNTEIRCLRGRTILWNQLVPTGGGQITKQIGHKYLVWNGPSQFGYIVDGAGTETMHGPFDCVYDLTLMFGAGKEPTSLEAFFAQTVGLSNDYTTGHLVSATADTVKIHGINLWDEEWESGTLNSLGEIVPASTGICSKNDISVLGGTAYYFVLPDRVKNSNEVSVKICYFDRSGVHLSDFDTTFSGTVSNYLFITPKDTAFIRFCVAGNYGAVYVNDICIQLSLNDASNGVYAASQTDTISLPTASYFPSGMKSVGNVYDELTPTAAIQRIGSRPYQSGDDTDPSALTDGITTYYVLPSPIETAISFDTKYHCESSSVEEFLCSVGGETVMPIAEIVYPIPVEEWIGKSPELYLNKKSLDYLLSTISMRIGYQIKAVWNEDDQAYRFSSVKVS